MQFYGEQKFAKIGAEMFVPLNNVTNALNNNDYNESYLFLPQKVKWNNMFFISQQNHSKSAHI